MYRGLYTNFFNSKRALSFRFYHDVTRNLHRNMARRHRRLVNKAKAINLIRHYSYEEIMKHRISVGAFVIRDNKILMVNHRVAGRYDFWVAPGGGVQDTESLEHAVAREVREETGLNVSVKKLLYVEEMYNPEERSVKFWYQCEFLDGHLDCTAKEAVTEHIVNVRFMGKDDIRNYKVFPPMLHYELCKEIERGEISPKFIGLRKMEFY